MISIILVDPQMGENIGGSARVMKNFGIEDLRIVNPRDGWPNEHAVAMSASASDILNNARIFDTVENAVADLEYLYAVTARHRDMVKPVITSQELGEKKQLKNTGIIFGGEKSGLSNKNIVLADKIVTISAAEYSSLNLAQAVGIICYECFAQEYKTSEKESPASKREISDLLNHLESELDNAGFFRVVEKRQKMSNNIRNIFTRTDLTQREVKILRGAISGLSQRKFL